MADFCRPYRGSMALRERPVAYANRLISSCCSGANDRVIPVFVKTGVMLLPRRGADDFGGLILDRTGW